MATQGNSGQNREADRRSSEEAGSRDANAPAQSNSTRSRRGFAAMNPETQRRIAAEGGRASHQNGRGHQWSSVEAREAGRKGGEARAENRQKAAAALNNGVAPKNATSPSTRETTRKDGKASPR